MGGKVQGKGVGGRLKIKLKKNGGVSWGESKRKSDGEERGFQL